MKKAFAIQHLAFEGLDGFAGPLEQAGYVLRCVNVADGVPRQVDDADLLIVLGGPIGANDTASYPHLTKVLRLIARRLNADAPTMGICLGAQLIAKAAGARVSAMGAKEIGFGSLTLTDAGYESCLSVYAEAPMAFHWHGDTFDLPAGARRLASSSLCENQAFALGQSTIGFQFHPEATCTNIEHWLIGHSAELGAAGIDPKGIRTDSARFAPELCHKADAVMRSWLKGLSS